LQECMLRLAREAYPHGDPACWFRPSPSWPAAALPPVRDTPVSGAALLTRGLALVGLGVCDLLRFFGGRYAHATMQVAGGVHRTIAGRVVTFGERRHFSRSIPRASIAFHKNMIE